MLRSIGAKKFAELQAYSEMYPFGEERMDIRFALLASLIAGIVGAKDKNKKPYTAEHFLRSLQFDNDNSTLAKTKGQSVEMMEMLIKNWTDASNVIHKEERKSRKRNDT